MRLRTPCAPWISTPSISAVAEGPVTSTAYRAVLNRGISIGVMQVADDIAGVEQCEEMLGQKGKRIHLQLRLAQPDRAGFGDSKSGPHDADIDIVQIRRVDNAAQGAVAVHFGRRRTDHLRLREQRSDEPRRGPPSWVSANLPPMRSKRLLKFSQQAIRRVARTAGYREDGRRRRLVGANAARIVSRLLTLAPGSSGTTAKGLSRGTGTSRCRPQALSRL